MVEVAGVSREELRASLQKLDAAVLVEYLIDSLLLVRQLQSEVTVLNAEVVRLKQRPDTHSGNSSMPPSSDHPKPKSEQKRARKEARLRRKKGKVRKQGGQPGHEGHFRPREDNPDVTKVHTPSECSRCHHPIDSSCILNDVKPIWHQRYELLERPVQVIEDLSLACLCPGCGEVTQEALPEEITKAAYGPRLSAVGLFLRGVAQSSVRDVVEFFQSVFKVPASLGTVSNFEGRLAGVLNEPYQEVLAAIQQARVVNVDDTGWYFLSERNVLWVATTNELVAYRIDVSKGRDAFQKVVGVDFDGIVGSDRAKAYDHLDPKLRQVCWAHLDRNFQKLFDAGGPGREMAEWALREIDALFTAWHRCQAGEISHEQLAGELRLIKARFRRLLDTGMNYPDASVHEICKSLSKLWDGLWTFSRVEGVEPTNNSAERGARPAVTLRKTSNGSQSARGNRFVETILTAVETLKKQGRNAYEYLVAAMEAWFQGVSAPSLLPDGPGG